MEFRRNASERRRRVLIEENLPENSQASAANPAAATTRSKAQQTSLQNYTQNAQRGHMPHVTDWLPKRRWTLAVLALAGMAVIAGLIALYGAFYVQNNGLPAVPSHAFDLERTDSIAHWFLAALLATAGHVSWLVYLMRRHRVDDYRGRYRVWIWFSALLLLASIESVAGVRHTISGIIYHWNPAGQCLAAEHWSLILAGSIGLVAFVRAAIEVRRSWGALSLLLLSVLGYAAVAIQLGFELLPVGPLRSMIANALLLLAHFALLACTVIYARYVYLDAHGCLARPAAKRETLVKRRAKTDSKDKKKSQERDDRRRTDLDKQVDEPKAAPKTQAGNEAGEKKIGATITAAGSRALRVDAAHVNGSSSADTGRKLSKAERKKLKRQAQG